MGTRVRRIALTLVLLLGSASGSPQSGSVANATFTSNVASGAPVDFRDTFFTGTSVVYYYSELLGLAGQTVTHRWALEGKVMQEVPIKVASNRHPAYSKMELKPQWTGNWTVTVADAKGQVIDRRNFAYNPQ